MYNLFFLYIVLFFTYETSLFGIPLNPNDILAFIFGSQTLYFFLFRLRKKFSQHTILFLNLDLERLIYISSSIIFIYGISSNRSILDSFVLGGRIFYIFISIFTTIFLMNKTFKYIEKRILINKRSKKME